MIFPGFPRKSFGFPGKFMRMSWETLIFVNSEDFPGKSDDFLRMSEDVLGRAKDFQRNS